MPYFTVLEDDISPFCGNLECTNLIHSEIEFAKGVCADCWEKELTSEEES